MSSAFSSSFAVLLAPPSSRRIAAIGLTAGLFTAALGTGAALALSGEEVNVVAREITVLIQGINPGSGVIIAREGNSYVVLTAKHVVSTEDQYKIITSDHQAYPLDYKTVKKFPGIDLAILTFNSSKDYRTARLANSDNAKEGATVFVSGWPNPGQSITSRIRQFTTGQLSARPDQALTDGYGLVYTNVTRAGMSGGPVLDTSGRVIGIHGRAESEAIDPSVQESASAAAPAKVGFNLGIPINTFVNQSGQAGVELGLRVENAPASDLSQPYVAPAAPEKKDTIDNINNVMNTLNKGVDMIQTIRSFFR